MYNYGVARFSCTGVTGVCGVLGVFPPSPGPNVSGLCARSRASSSTFNESACVLHRSSISLLPIFLKSSAIICRVLILSIFAISTSTSVCSLALALAFKFCICASWSCFDCVSCIFCLNAAVIRGDVPSPKPQNPCNMKNIIYWIEFDELNYWNNRHE